jgi:4-hydroxybenzoate polyprenyltransferase
MNTRLLPWLRLCRFAAVFTALADIAAGYLLSHPEISSAREFLLLLGASAGLYLSGMVFNDVFDVEQDRRERSQRPIPSGSISRRGAALFGSILMVAGLICAGLAARNSLLVALLLASMIVLYDGVLKRTPLGPLAMGGCRLLNIILGASSAGLQFAAAWQMPQLWMAASLGVYVTGITVFAGREALISRRALLGTGLLIIDAGLAMFALWITGTTISWGLIIGPPGVPNPLTVLAVWAMIAFTINRQAISAIVSPVPEQVQRAVGLMLLSIISLDALMIYFKLGDPGMVYVVGTLFLILPAVVLRRLISMT